MSKTLVHFHILSPLHIDLEIDSEIWKQCVNGNNDAIEEICQIVEKQHDKLFKTSKVIPYIEDAYKKHNEEERAECLLGLALD